MWWPTVRGIHSLHHLHASNAHDFQKTEIEIMLVIRPIVPAQTEVASLVYLTSKRDETPRLCSNCKKLNTVFTLHSYSLPRKDKCADFCKDIQVFSVLEASSEYWKINVVPSDRKKPALKSHYVFQQISCMPSRLKHSPGTLQPVMDVILSSVKQQFAYVYLDDMDISLSTLHQHIEHTRIFKSFKETGVSLKLKSVPFSKPRLTMVLILSIQVDSKA